MVATNGSRDVKGRFLKGHSVKSPGRPAREVEREYLQAFHQGCPPEKLVQVVAKITEQALVGDMVAARLLLQHAMPVMVRMELMSHVPEEQRYRVAGRSPSSTNGVMLARLHDAIRRTRERDQASGSYPQFDSKVEEEKSVE